MRKKRLQKIVALLMIVAMILNLTPSGLTIGLADEAEPAANSADSTVADATTSSDWEEQMSSNSQVSSENIGRIWTDKSVTEDSVNLNYGGLQGQSIKKTDGADFLVELSALSSTSSLTQSTTEAQPLDIVLVLDVSGSMDDTLSTEYTPVYTTLSTSSSYYVLVNGTYYTVRYTSGSTGGGPGGSQQAGWYYTTGNGPNSTRTYVVPLTSETDTTSGSVQFYTLTTTTKMDALQDAVNSFIESVAQKNDAITETTKRHQISVVKFAGTVSDKVGNYTYNSMGNTYNYTQILSDWTTYTKDNVSTLTSLISSLNAGGATYADDGLAFAQTLLSRESVRSDAQQVVIFFTDGEPNNGSGFWPSEATNAVNIALNIKNGSDNVTGTNEETKVNDDVLVYSIAIYEGADSTDTKTNINAYLNAVSSNYPEASANGGASSAQTGNDWATENLTLGDRVSEEKDTDGNYKDNYYLVAEDADGLSEIFTDILNEISESSVTSPTHIEGDDPSAGGYVTFEDELGAFMEVKGINAVVLEEQIYGDDDAEKPTVVSTVTNRDGSVTTTYQFPSIAVTGNVVHTDMGNLKDIVIEVVSYPDNPSKGDVVTVKIPATLLPLLYYDIDTADGVTSIKVDYDWPLRFFYSVGLKTGVADAMESGDYSSIDGLTAYVAANTDSSTGEVYFYSNYYDKTEASDGYTYGDTTATFVPALTNSFYYFQSNVAIYTDKDCTTQLTGSVVAGTTYYYKNEYYVEAANASTGVATLQSDIVEFSVDSVTATYFTTVDGYTYIAAGAPRVSLGEGQSFAGTKTEEDNATGTADYYLYPTWTVGSNAVTYLGNNGRIGYGAAGNLSVSKTVEAASNLSPDADAEFTFTVRLFESDGTTALTGSYTYSVVDSETGEAVTDQQGNEVTGTVTNGGTLTLKDGQTAVIIGLPAGSRYTVTENNGNTLPGGYSISDTTVSDGTDTTTASTTSGAIVSATTAVADFTNTYKVEKVTVDTSATISAAKILSGRSWLADDEFIFYLIPANGTTVLPDTSKIEATTTGATATVTTFTYTSSVTAVRIALKAANGTADGTPVEFNLGSFTFTEPGTYTYRLQEYEGSISGITYSDATYSVVFTVTDNGAGKLVATYKLTQDTDDYGASVGTEDADGVASFTNMYDTDTEQIEVSAYKSLNGGTPPVGSFEFKFTALKGTDGVKLPSGVTASSDNTDDEGNVTWTTASQNAGAVLSGKIEVEASDAGKTYEYLVQEVIPDEAMQNTDGTYTLNGVVYDSSVYKYSYKITYDVPAGSTSEDKVVGYSLTVYKMNANGEFETYIPPTDQSTTEVTFYNTATVTIGDDTNAGIEVTKTLTGREWISGDSFEFTLTAGSNTASGSIATPMPTSNTVTISYNAGQNYTASFGEITYSAPGVYTYTLAEKQGSIPGIAYDGKTITVTVTVTQASDASLSAEVAYSTGEDATSAEFTNSYDAEDYVTTETTFRVSKTISGRDWIANSDMFYFTIEAGVSTDADGNTITTPMPSRTQIAASSTSTNPSFTDLVTYTEAGTYVYYIKETKGSISGITYDKSIYKVVVEVTDNYEKGKLEAAVTYYRGTPDANGNVADSDWAAASSNVAAFTNTYKAAPYTTRYVGASKMIVGFDMEDGDEFTFTLEAYDADTKTAVADGTVTVTPDVTSNLITDDVLSVATVSGLNSGNTAGFTFGSITFTKAGVYMFAIKEVKDDSISGVTYDSHTVYAKVTVTDNGTGALSATIAYTSSEGTVNNDWTFININDNDNTKTVTGTDESGNVVNIDGELVEVGDALTYTISWTNDYYDSTGAAAAATVTITDVIPEYTTLVENSISDGGTYDDSARTITWNIDAAKAATGTVSFSVTVTGDTSAEATGKSLVIANEAEVKAGSNTADKTNKTTNYTPLTVDNLFQVQKKIVDDEGNTITAGTYPWTVVAELDENDSDEEYWFRFVLEAVSAPDGVDLESILPGGTKTDVSPDSNQNPLIATNIYSGDKYNYVTGFGSVTYTAEGTYVYDLWERSPIMAAAAEGKNYTGEPIPGVSYSQQLYRVTVKVEFNETKGVLEVTEYTVTLVDDETGEPVNTTEYTTISYSDADNSYVMVITNTYNQDKELVSFRGIKSYEDKSGATTMAAGAFSFKFTTVSADAPVPESTTDVQVTDNGDGTYSWTVTAAANGQFTSTDITYEPGDVGIYYYKVEEVLPVDAYDDDTVKDGFQYKNMTYDTNTYYVRVVVTYVDTDEDETADTVEVSTSFVAGTDDGNGNVTESQTETAPVTSYGRIEFTNIYDPDDVDVDTKNTEEGFGLTKTISGRNWTEDDSFEFTLTAGSNTASGNIETPMPDGSEKDGTTGVVTKTISVTGSSNSASAIDFGTITYKKVGVYTYYVKETSTDGSGITVDSEERTITVEVTLDAENNELVAKVSVDGDKEFTNNYSSSGTYTGMSLRKTLVGRNMKGSEFSFIITAGDEDSAAKLQNAGLAASGENSYTVTNAAALEGIEDVKTILGGLRFTQADVGKTYTYTVKEQLPTEDDASTAGIQSKGVTYDQSVYQVEITLEDDNAGEITATAKITRLKKTDGTDAAVDGVYPDVTNAGITFENTYAATGTLDGSSNLKVAKTLTGRAGGSEEKFTFELKAVGYTDLSGTKGDVEVPMPADNAVSNESGGYVYRTTVNAPTTDGETSTGAFGNITFTETGFYTYTITEVEDTNGISHWSGAEYTVVVRATDIGDGTLSIAVMSFVLTKDQYGATSSNAVTNNTATFENTYVEKEQEKEVSTDINGVSTQVNGQYVSVGSTLTYTIDWYNTAVGADGNAAAATVKVVDTVPAGTSLTGDVSYVVYNVNGGKIDITPTTSTENGEITVTFENVPANAYGTVSFTVIVTEDACDAGTVENQATITIGDHAPVYTNTVESEIPTKDVTDANGNDIDGQLVGVDDVLTYTIDWVNTAVDENGDPTTGTITITDEIPVGTDYVENSATYSVTGGTATVVPAYNSTEGTNGNGMITWTITAGAGAYGTVSFKAVVSENAVDNEDQTVTNKATIKIGENSYDTNTTTNYVPKKTGAVDSGSESSVLEVGDVITYTVTFKNTAGTADHSIKVVDSLAVGLEYQANSSTVKVGDTETSVTPTVTGTASGGETLTWNLENLTLGATVTITFKVQVTSDADANVANSAIVDGHKSNTEITPVPAVDDKHVFNEQNHNIDGEVVSAGQVLTYEISWTNEMTDTDGNPVTDESGKVVYAETVTIVDTLPDGVTVLTTDNGKYNETNRTITWTFENLDTTTMQRGTIVFEVTVDGTEGTITNEAVISANNVTRNVSVYNIVPEKDVAKDGSTGSEDGGTILVGDVLTYEVSYTNPAKDADGNDGAAADIVITDAAPAGTTLDENSVTYTVVAADNTDLTGNYAAADVVTKANDGTITWTFENVPAGATVVAIFKVTVTEEALKEDGNKVANKATVTVNDTPAVTREVVNYVVNKDVELTINGVTTDVDGKTVGVGDVLTYTIDWANTATDESGNEVAATVVVTDTIPNGTVFVKDNVAETGATSVSYIVDGKAVNKIESEEEAAKVTAIEWTFENVAAGTSGVVSFDVIVSENAVDYDTVNNTASIKVGDNEAVSTNETENYVPEKTVALVTENEQGETEYEDVTEVEVGQVLAYTITFHNTDGEGASATVIDTLSQGLEYVTGSAAVTVDGTVYSDGDEATADDGTPVVSGQTLTWTLVNLAKDADVTITFETLVTMDALGSVDNTALVAGHKSNTTTTPVADKDEKDVTDGDVNKTTGETTSIDGTPVNVGDELTYVIYWTNDTGETATVTVTDKVPANTTFVKDSNTSTVEGGTFGIDEGTGVLTWTFADQPAGTHGMVTFKVTVDNSAAGTTVKNTATIEIGENESKVTKTTNETENDVPGEPEETPLKTVSESSTAGSEFVEIDEDSKYVYEDVNVGSEITYEIEYYNYNVTEATITITDELDPDVEFVNASGTLKSADTENEKVVYELITDESGRVTKVIWTIQAEKFERDTVKLTVKVLDSAKAIGEDEDTATVENVADVQIGEDPENTWTSNIVVNPITPEDPEDPTKTVSESSPNGYDATATTDESGTLTGGSLAIGDIVEYDITYYNNNNTVAVVTIKDTLDPGVDFVKATGTEKSVATADDQIVYELTTDENGIVTVTWTITGVAPFSGNKVTLQVRVNEKAKLVESGEEEATVSNKASVQIGNDTAVDTNTVENPIDPDDPSDPSKVVAADSEGAGNAGVSVGDEVTYIISYYNNESVSADVTIIDVLDSGVDFVKATGTVKSDATDADTVVYEVTAGADGKVTVTWTITDVAPFTAGNVELTVKVNENAKKIADGETQATIANTASVKIGNDPAVNTNTAENPIDPDDPTDPTKTIITEGVKEGDTVEAGDVLTYEIGYYNHTNNVATVTVTDKLDAGVDYKSSTDGGVYDKTTHTVTWTLTVDPFTEGSVSVTIEVNETAAKQISNTAYVKIENDSDSDTDTENPGGSDEPDDGTPTNTVTNPVKEEEPTTPEPTTQAPTQPVATTSDTEAVVPYTVIMLMAFAAIVILLKSRREENA